MRAIYIFSIVAVLTFNCAYTQEVPSQRFVSTIEKCGYSYVPAIAFNDSVQGVLNTFYGEFDKACQRKEFTFSWSSIDIDGGYNLTVTPEQIFFYSSHDNPNHNYLYWAINIDTAQYSRIFAKLKKAQRLYSSVYKSHYVVKFKKAQDTEIPIWSTNREWDSVLENYCILEKRNHLERYFAMMNSYLPVGTKKVQLPSEKELERFHPKLTSFSQQELVGWLSQKKKKN